MTTSTPQRDPHDRTRDATAVQLGWLHRELADWQAAGIIGADQAAAISARYRTVRETRRFSLGRLLLALGALFVGVGLIWLVAANLDQLPPLLRFAVVAAFWLAFLVGGELVGPRLSTGVLGAVRLLAALTFGATIFQAAQSMQVPAYEPLLLGLWSAGTLLHAYATRSLVPLLVGIATGMVWWTWQPLADSGNGAGVVLALGTASVLAVSLAVVHDRGLDLFAAAWRTLGCALAMAALFVAAVPYTTTDGFEWNTWLVLELAAAGVAATAALVLARGNARWEPLGALGVLAFSVLMVLWDTGTDTSSVGLDDWAHAAVGVAAYVVVAVGLAALGTLRDTPVLTVIAMMALVVFTTFQSFAVFAAIIQGAWLFVVLGLVFLGTGFLFDRARRGISANLEGA
ncbi:DUF2157 domain-containing protein [Nocardioides sp. Soil805]|uniref:DUF2157 domain-containing protein n=1 Tax=Nocardioides sp. Soil805 TaxID=1736416 RepID=UPI000702C9C6|nr:DUF2157 domain-containing protein [Nocardioides sp. Soil805]KRF35135.1 hypothetical protein ASG94_13515 [Nocardioides sp. Soil805]